MALRRTFYDPAAEDLTAAPAVPDDPKAHLDTPAWGGWTADNVFDTWDLNPLASQYGMQRDDLANQRDAFLNPYASEYRKRVGVGSGGADEGDFNLYNDESFRNFVKTGQLSGGGSQTRTPSPYNGPMQQVGGDALSQNIDKTLMQLMNGGEEASSPWEKLIQGKLTSFLDQTGKPQTDQEKAMRFELARQPLDKMRRTQTNAAKGQLAARNLLSVPGIQQGPEIGALQRIEENLAPEYAKAGQELYFEDQNRQGQDLDRQLAALGIGAGIGKQQNDNRLAAANAATNRQNVLSDIALGTLDRNIAWNQFLANFGLDRDKVMNELQSGQVDDLMQILEMFQNNAALSQRGNIG